MPRSIDEIAREFGLENKTMPSAEPPKLTIDEIAGRHGLIKKEPRPSLLKEFATVPIKQATMQLWPAVIASEAYKTGVGLFRDEPVETESLTKPLEPLRQIAKEGGYGLIAGAIPGLKGTMTKEKALEGKERYGVLYEANKFLGSIAKYYLIGQAMAPLAPIVAKTDVAREIADKSLALKEIVTQVSPKVAGALPFISEQVAGYSASRGATWFTASVLDTLGELILGTKEPTYANLLSPFASGIWGAVLGLSHAFVEDIPKIRLGEGSAELKGSFFDIPKALEETGKSSILNSRMLAIGAILGGLKSGLPKIYKMIDGGKINKQDILEVTSNAMFTGFVEAVGHDQMMRSLRQERLQEFSHDKLVGKFISNGTFKDRAEAEQYIKDYPKIVKFASGLLSEKDIPLLAPKEGLLANNKIDAAKIIIDLDSWGAQVNNVVKNTLTLSNAETKFTDETPIQFDYLMPDQKERIVNDVVSAIKDKGMSFADAWNSIKIEIAGMLSKTKLMPELELGKIFTEGTLLRRKAQNLGKFYEDRLKKKGIDQTVIDAVKRGKSFSAKKENAMTPGESLIIANELREVSRLMDKVASNDITKQKQLTKKVMALLDEPEKISIEKGLKEIRLKKELKPLFGERISKIEDREEFNLLWERAKIKEPDEAQINTFFKNYLMFKETEFNGEIGRKAGLFAPIRPTRLVFRRDPYVYFYGYKPLHDGAVMAHNLVHEENLKARKFVKKLGLEKTDLEAVANYRMIHYFHSQGLALDKDVPVLTKAQNKWNQYLTQKFTQYKKDFNVTSDIPSNIYLPLFHDDDVHIDEKLSRYINPQSDKIPRNLDAFFKKKRESRKTDKYKANSLELFESYMMSGAREMFLSEPLRLTKNMVLTNPKVSESMRFYLGWYTRKILGYPTVVDETYAETLRRVTGGRIDDENLRQFVNNMMDLTYTATLGLRPTKMLKNLTQSLNSTYAIGPQWVSAGVYKFIRDGFAEAKQAGILLDYAPELHDTASANFRDTFMYLFSLADRVNRSVAYYGSTTKFDAEWLKYKTVDSFMAESGVKYIDKPKRAEIKQALLDGDYKNARHLYGEEISAKTQYLYRNMDSPLVTSDVFGRQVFQFQSWRENNIELIQDFIRNKNYKALMAMVFTNLGLLYASIVAGELGYKGTKKALRAGMSALTLPTDPRDFDLIPVTLDPAFSLIQLARDGIKYVLPSTYKDPVTLDKELEKSWKKTVGSTKTLLRTYAPGFGLARDIYNLYNYLNDEGFEMPLSKHTIGRPQLPSARPGYAKNRPKIKYKKPLVLFSRGK